VGLYIIDRYVVGFEGFNEVLGILALEFSFELFRKAIETLETPMSDTLSTPDMTEKM
jgi:hypothetical protein